MNAGKKNYLIPLLLTLTLLLSFPFASLGTGLNQASAEPDAVSGSGPLIAVILPLSGPFAEYGKILKQGYEQGFAGATAAAGVAGPRYRVKYLDSRADPENARSLINQLSSEGEVAIATGTPLNATAWTASCASEKNHLPYLIVGANQDNLINRKTASVFRLTPKHSALRQMLTDFIAVQKPGIKSMGIIYGNSVCAVKKARQLRALCAEVNIDLSIWKQWRILSRNRNNFYDLLNAVKERRPEILFLVTGPELTNRLWQQGHRLEIMPALSIAIPSGTYALTATADSDKPDAVANQLLYATPWLNQSHNSAAEKNISTTADNPLSAAGTAAAKVIMNCLERSLNLTAAEIIKSMEATKLNTTYGPVRFTAKPSGHQNQARWYLCRTQENGPAEIIFPAPK